VNRYHRQGTGAYLGRGVILLLYAVPLVWVLATSLKSEGAVLTDPSGLRFTPTLEQYSNLLPTIWPSVLNSAQIAVGTVALTLGLAVPAAYGLARRRTPGWTKAVAVLLGAFILLQMVPQPMTLMPLYRILAGWGLTNTIIGLVVVNSAFMLPFAIVLLRPFFQSIPSDLEEAAALEGASLWRTFRSVILPLASNGVITVGVMVFMLAWGEFLYGTTFLTEPDAYPVGALLVLQTSLYGTQWGRLMALSVLISLPILVVFLFAQRRLLEGMLSGAIK